MKFKLETQNGPLHFRDSQSLLNYLRVMTPFSPFTTFYSIDDESLLKKIWSFEIHKISERAKVFYLRVKVLNTKTHVQSYEIYQYDQLTGAFLFFQDRFIALMSFSYLLTSSDFAVFTSLFDAACGNCLRRTSYGSPIIAFAHSFVKQQIHVGTTKTMETFKKRHKQVVNKSTTVQYTQTAVDCFHNLAKSSTCLTLRKNRRVNGTLSKMERIDLLIQSGMLKELCRRLSLGPGLCYNKETGMHEMCMRVNHKNIKTQLGLALLRKIHRRMLCKNLVCGPEGMFGSYLNRNFISKMQYNICLIKMLKFLSDHFPTGDTRCTITLSETEMETVCLDPTIEMLTQVIQKRFLTPIPTKRAAIAGGGCAGGECAKDDTDTDE